MKISSLLKQVRKDLKSEYGDDLPNLLELAAGVLPAPFLKYRSFRVLALSAAALVAVVLLGLVWAATGSFSLAVLAVLAGFGWGVSSYLGQREKRRKDAVRIPVDFATEVCKNASRLKLPVGLVDVLGLELIGWYTPHNNFFARWPWVRFSIPLDLSTTANLSNPHIAENTLYLLNQYAAAFSQKTQSPPLVIRNLHFSRNSLEFEVVLDAGRDAREFLAETASKTTLAGIDDPDFGAPPNRGRGNGR